MIVKEEFHRTNKERILHTLYLFLPVVMAFAGYYISSPLCSLLTKKATTPELFKFAGAVAFFLITSLIIFIITRKSSPVMSISLLDVPEQAEK